jgi:hypothetical protein
VKELPHLIHYFTPSAVKPRYCQYFLTMTQNSQKVQYAPKTAVLKLAVVVGNGSLDGGKSIHS